MRSIALFLPNWIGDVVMATPAIRAIREHFANASLVGVCKPYVAEVLSGSSWFTEIIPYDKHGSKPQRTWGAVSRLARFRPDAAVLFPNTFRSAALARLAGCRRVIGFARYFRDVLLTDRLYPARDRCGRLKPTPILDDYNRLARRLGVPDVGQQMELFTTPADEAAADAIWANARLNRFSHVIGLNPGGAFGAAKHWPTNHFVELARKLAEQGYGVLALCGPAERESSRAIATSACHPNIVSLANNALSLGLTKACVRRLSLLVTTDSGPRHFAAAFGVPVVTLFGPTHIAWTETYFPQAIHLQKQLPCGPCQRRVCPLGHHRCMVELTPAEVITAVARLLSQTEVQRAG
jgi:heptosyltransferase-2